MRSHPRRDDDTRQIARSGAVRAACLRERRIRRLYMRKNQALVVLRPRMVACDRDHDGRARQYAVISGDERNTSSMMSVGVEVWRGAVVGA